MQSLIPAGKINWLNVVGFILVLCIVYCTVNDQNVITSRLIAVTFIYTTFLYFKEFFSQKISSSYNKVLWGSIFLVFINVSISGFGDISYYKKAIMYISTLMLLIYSVSVNISQKTAYIGIAINLIIGALYILSYQNGFDIYEGEVLLTLNFSNPNMAGIFLTNTLLYILLPLSSFQKHQYCFLTILLIAIILPLFLSLCGILTMTGCRSAMMALMVFVLLSVWDYLMGDKFRLKKWMFKLIAILPFLFTILYVRFSSSISFDVSMGIEHVGKTAMTRIKIWGPIINDFFHYLAIGDYYGISNGTGMSQLHNTHLDIFASYGIIPLIMYIYLVAKVLWQSYERSTTRFQRSCVYAFIACMVIGTFEASFVAGSAGLYVLTNGFVLLANCQNSENSTSQLCLSER